MPCPLWLGFYELDADLDFPCTLVRWVLITVPRWVRTEFIYEC